jgi:hypothetical protein
MRSAIEGRGAVNSSTILALPLRPLRSAEVCLRFDDRVLTLFFMSITNRM